MKLIKINDFEWELPKTGKMNVPGRIFADETLLEDIKKDKTLEQIQNVAMLPGILKASFAMPDAHQGYGFPIGGVAGFDLEKGAICPGGVGYDINCSIRLLKTNLTLKDLEKVGKKFVGEILLKKIPSGVGKDSPLKLTKKELDEVLVNGAQWAVQKGFGSKEDITFTEEKGKLKNANPKDVGQRAKARGMIQLGTLGAGNHFLELGVVEEIIDEKIARILGLEKGKITIMIHCGSRGLGHQVASDSIKEMERVSKYPEKNRELVHVPIKSKLGQKYLSAMNCAGNFAFANKQIITYWIREELKRIFPEIKIEVVYDVCHNIAKIENHFIDGKEKEILVIRKGATRSFGKGNKEIPEKYQSVGQPIILPGSMGTASYILVGTNESDEKSFSSTAHGAGRVESRKNMKSESGKEIKKRLENKGILIETNNVERISEEAPKSYKDIEKVVKVSEKNNLGKIVARLKPVIVVKG